MSTVIDSLVVTLGLDRGDFTRGSKEATSAFEKTKEEARRSGKDIEASGRSAAESINGIARAALSMFAIFAGARSIKDFVQQIGLADSALGRLAVNLSSTPERLSAIANAVERNGGSANTAVASMRSLSDSFTELKNTGNTGILPMLQQLQGKSGVPIDIMHGFEKALPGISESLRVLKARNPADASWFGRQIGIDDETVNFLAQGWRKVSAEMERSKRLGGVTKESAEAAQKLVESWRELEQAARDLGRQIFVGLAPAFTDIIKKIGAWIEANKEWLNTKIREEIERFISFLRSIDWAGILAGIKSFISDANGAAQAVGGWRNVVEGLFALWVGSKFLTAMAAIGRMRGALLALGIPELLAAFAAFKGLQAATGMGNHDPRVNETEGALGGAIERFEAYKRGHPKDTSSFEYQSLEGSANQLRRYRRDHGYGPDVGEGNNALRRRGRSAGPSGVPFSATSMTEGTGINQAQYDAFREGLTDIEGKRYDRMGGAGHRFAGRYQMGPAEITQTAARLGVPRPSTAQFLADPHMQERFFENYTRDHYNTLMRHPRFAAMPPEEKLKMLGYAHNQGAGGPRRNNGAWGYLSTGRTGSDAWGTSGTAYFGPIGERLRRLGHDPVRSAIKPIPQARSFLDGSVGAAGSAAASISHDNRVSHSSSSDTKIGHISIYPPSGDPHEIAKSIGPAIERHSFATHANYGPA